MRLAGKVSADAASPQTMTIAHSIIAILSLLCVALTPALVGAQTRLFVTLRGQQQCNNCETEYALEIDVDNARLVDQAVIRDANSTASVATTADGRYLIWIGKEGLGPITLSALDSVTNTMVVNTPRAGANLLNSVYAHPSRMRVFVADGATILALEPQGQQTFSPGGPGCPFARLTGISRSGERLFVSCSIGLGLPGETRVLDSETGTLLSSLADIPPLQAPNVAGTELFHIQTTPSVILTRRDAMTGAVLAQRDISTITQSAFAISIDPVTGRIFLVGTNVTPSAANHMTIFEPDDLALVTRFVAPHQFYPQIRKPVFSDEDAPTGRPPFNSAADLVLDSGCSTRLIRSRSQRSILQRRVRRAGSPWL